MIDGMVVQITRSCNLKCAFCLSSSGIPDPNEITAEQIIEYLEKNPQIHFVTITGGEPLSGYARAKTEAVADYVFRNMNRYMIRINTNGTFAPIAEAAYDQMHKLVYQVSLDGMREDHDAVRGKGVFDKACGFIREAKDLGARAHVMSVITENRSMESIKELIDFCKNDLGVTPKFQILSQVGRGKDLNKPKMSHQEIVDTVNAMGGECRPLIHKCDTILHVGSGGRIAFDNKGNVIPCPYLSNYSIGHISENLSEEEIRQRMTAKIGGLTCYNAQS